MRAELLSYAAQVLGRCTAVQDCSWDHAQSAVLRMRDAEGTSWFLKRHREAERYRPEVGTYRDWAPALGDEIPRRGLPFLRTKRLYISLSARITYCCVVWGFIRGEHDALRAFHSRLANR